MSTTTHRSSVVHLDDAALHDQALRRAQVLRREAVGDFWRGADAIWSAGLASARRSAQRLAHSLARHARSRQTPSKLEG